MGMSYYRMQQLGVEQMYRDLAKPRTSACELCGSGEGLSTQLTPSAVMNEGLSGKPKCSSCWKRFWAARDAGKAAEKI